LRAVHVCVCVCVCVCGGAWVCMCVCVSVGRVRGVIYRILGIYQRVLICRVFIYIL